MRALALPLCLVYLPPMPSFVTLTAAQFDAKFLTAGFTKTTAYREVVYTRAHRDSRYTIKVYSSLTVGADQTRDVGADAIRVCLVFTAPTGKTYGVGKATRVNRVGTPEAVLDRTIVRAREMWALANTKLGACTKVAAVAPVVRTAEAIAEARYFDREQAACERMCPEM